MKRLVSLGLFLAVASLAYVQAASSPASSADEKAVAKLEQDWAVALVKKDLATIDAITSPDWVVTLPDGTMVTKAQFDSDLKSGVVVFTEFKVEDLKVKVYGDTAVAFGLETEKSTYKGSDMSGQYRFTDVFTKRNGKWTCVATHVSKVEKK